MKYVLICLFAGMTMAASCNQAGKTSGTGNAASSEPAAPAAAAPTAPAAEEKSHFDKTIEKEKLTMVDFYTVWCGPCKKMAPYVETILETRVKDVNVLSIDAEKESAISARYNLEGYPTLIFFKNGKEIHRVLGYQDLAQLNALVDKLK